MTEPIRRLLRHASCWADPEHGDGRGLRTALGDTTPLSPEGLELALTHLETDATDDAIAAMIASANAAQGGPAGRAHVQLAGNVCVAALRAVAFALAGAPAVSLRPSRRDPALARTIAAAMPEVTLVEALAPSPGDAVHLYGRDETMAAMGPFPDCHVLRFGTGFGVAVVARGRDHDAAANRVAADLVAFDGAGCISPRLVLTEAPHETFDALHEALNRHGDAIPRGTLEREDRAALRRAADTFSAIGRWIEGESHALALDPAPEALAMLPPLRSAIVAPLAGFEAWLPFEKVTVVGGAGSAADGVAHRAPWARRAALGRMQRLPFDGPVDLRPFGGDTWAREGDGPPC